MKQPNETKTPWSYLPMDALKGIAKAMKHGEKKHGDKSYLQHGDGERVYFEALIRHLFAWFYDSQTIDKESGIHHLDLAGANLVILIDRLKQIGNAPPYFDMDTVKVPERKTVLVMYSKATLDCPFCGEQITAPSFGEQKCGHIIVAYKAKEGFGYEFRMGDKKYLTLPEGAEATVPYGTEVAFVDDK